MRNRKGPVIVPYTDEDVAIRMRVSKNASIVYLFSDMDDYLIMQRFRERHHTLMAALVAHQVRCMDRLILETHGRFY